MTSVFIGGSRRLGRVNASLARRLDNIMDKRLCGFDRAAQAHFAESKYAEVLVYCTAGVCRNNVGDWPVRVVEYQGKDRGRAFYTAKDDAMVREADYGLFAWDGKSKGTLRNVQKLAERNRPSSVYVSPIRRFLTVRTISDARKLAADVGDTSPVSEELFSDAWRESTETGRGCLDHVR